MIDWNWYVANHFWWYVYLMIVIPICWFTFLREDLKTWRSSIKSGYYKDYKDNRVLLFDTLEEAEARKEFVEQIYQSGMGTEKGVENISVETCVIGEKTGEPQTKFYIRSERWKLRRDGYFK